MESPREVEVANENYRFSEVLLFFSVKQPTYSDSLQDVLAW